MPEAAEVTVVAEQLASVALGRRLESLVVTHPRTTRGTDRDDLDGLVGGVVQAVHRHGKWLVVDVGRDRRLGIHLRMSGQLLAVGPGAVPDPRHTHAVVALGSRHGHPVGPEHVPSPPAGAPGTVGCAVDVCFRDPRTFGELRALDRAPVAADLHDPAVTPDTLAAGAARRRVGVKGVLLDQTGPIAGVGSYLADEALHRAGISPLAPARELHVDAWDRILDAARTLAWEMAAVGGVTLADEGWVDLWGRPGRGADRLAVHARPTCATCGAPTRTATVGGRRARWCRRCQPARRRR